MLKFICVLIAIIPEVIAIRYIWVGMKKWKNKYPTNKLNRQQVEDNIANGMRIDYATGKETNWRHTWNSANPKEHKILEYASVWIKGAILFFVLWIVFQIILYIGMFMIAILNR